MIKIKELLSRGVFPSQLPPCFTSKLLGDKYNPITKSFKDKSLNARKCVNVRPEIYSVSRTGHSRRLTSIVNPIPQFYLARLIAQNWKEIEKHYSKSNISLSRPAIVEQGSRAINFTPIKELNENKVIKSSGYKYVLISDVTQFFPTIYTHTIGWALDGRDVAKPKQYARNLHLNDLGILLDKKVGHCQSNQTIGIPIGPDTSHIIAEIIGTAIDIELVKKLGFEPSGFRFVDDYYLFFDTKTAAEDALAKLSSSMSHYELKINSIKTQIKSIEDLSEETWKYTLQQFTFEASKRRQRNSINYYFDVAFRAAKSHQDENVMVYAVKKLKSFIVKKENWDLFESYLCKLLLAYPNTIQDIAHLLCTYEEYGYIVNKVGITRTLNQLIIDHALLDHHSEIAWALWLAKELNVKISSRACLSISQVTSSICLILAYDLELLGNLETPLDKNRIKEFWDPKELWRTNWLFAYEVGIRNWMGATDTAIANDEYFGVLHKYKVSFYDPNNRLEPIFTPKNMIDSLDLEDLFNSDEDLEDSFDFMEEVEDYNSFRDLTFDVSKVNNDELEEQVLDFENFEDDIPF